MSKKRRYVIIMPIEDIRLAAMVCYERGLDVDVFECHLGTCVARNIPVIEYDEWDIRNITGPDARDEEEQAAINADLSNRPWEIAHILAGIVPDGVILTTAELADENGYHDGLAGNISCTYISHILEEEETSIGYVLATAPDDDLEHIILDEAPEHTERIHVADLKAEEVGSWIREFTARVQQARAREAKKHEGKDS